MIVNEIHTWFSYTYKKIYKSDLLLKMSYFDNRSEKNMPYLYNCNLSLSLPLKQQKDAQTNNIVRGIKILHLMSKTQHPKISAKKKSGFQIKMTLVKKQLSHFIYNMIAYYEYAKTKALKSFNIKLLQTKVPYSFFNTTLPYIGSNIKNNSYVTNSLKFELNKLEQILDLFGVKLYFEGWKGNIKGEFLFYDIHNYQELEILVKLLRFREPTEEEDINYEIYST